MLPQDPYILLGVVNTKLRDECAGLDELCHTLETDRATLVGLLAQAGYAYDPAANQFKSV